MRRIQMHTIFRGALSNGCGIKDPASVFLCNAPVKLGQQMRLLVPQGDVRAVR
jgi:hypothetical protein